MFGKKAAYFLIVLSGLMLIGCGGGSSSDSPSSLPDDNTTFPDVVLHNDSFTTTHFSGSQNCAQCHNGITDANGTDVSIVKAWQGTMMANAATDPLWKAKVATEVKEHPEYKEIIEGKCSRCHTPMANVEATYNSDTVSLLGDGFLNHDNEYYDAAMQGVSCTLCHQIENTPELGTTEGFTGGFVIDTNNTGTDRKIYGPFMNPRTGPMQNSVQFTPEYSPHMNESKLCASCHSLETPVIATDGTITDETFPEQAAYTEWEYSDFNGTQSCQDCHMPKAEGSVVISTRGNNLEQRAPFFQHKFLGANTYMLEILKKNRVKLGVLADEARFNESITDTREFLKAAADVNITQWNFENGLLNFDVQITNHSGHKFPTGFPSRRAWLHVTVKNSADQIVFESGAINSEGQITGVVYDTATNTYEPHYDKITDPSQVQIYETILEDTDDNMTYILLHALHYFKDNRILPRGLDKNDVNLPETINPHGNAETDNNFIGGSDTVEYEIALPADNYTITAKLHYQTLSYGFAQDLYKNTQLPEVALMKALDARTTNRYETISTDTVSIVP
ncbi:multiheme c-type cytochrome [Sulfurovum sp. XTW-4]|uniref:Multiheme c-type cytochrome n=1 Tax=Sulfurovum xiamenensis TaxID=3019066 RepID=A0ABT7QQU9_9BACT|nr:multiheme c-type cytochrome [Sulfurovum xiamenensis]MDM5263473.1 multiheme c-type cytochrome [Sulfurovum xiamenensis]